LWLDIDHTYEHRYFKFNPFTFPAPDVERMNTEISESKRRLVLIADPHIKVDQSYDVYRAGLNLQKRY
jgi:alpha-glucosidase (family GH31 glycosyl hydrolase)